MNSEYLINIKEEIEKMDLVNQKEILKIFKNNNVNISENNNGSFINLSNISKEVLSKVEKHIDYFNKQQNNLAFIEEEKINIKNEFFFCKEDKKNSTTNVAVVNNI